MKLYFFGNSGNPLKGDGLGLISIMMPDLGVIYRTRFEGSQPECEYTAAIMAVKFIEKNHEFLGKQNLELLTDSSNLVHQVNQDLPLHGPIKVYRDTVKMYLKKYELKLSWVPRSENRAAQIVPKLPPLKIKLDLDFDFGQGGNDSTLGAFNANGNYYRVG